jgi:hypothetical protein
MTNEPIVPQQPSIQTPASSPSIGPRSKPAQIPGSKTEATAPAFQALLEELQEKARTLEQVERTAGDPASLAGAVDVARESLADALTLGEGLLEAYREAEQQKRGDPADPRRNP